MSSASQKGGKGDAGGEVVLRGVSVCPGVGIGLAHVVDPALSVEATELAPQRVEAEQERYAAAVDAARRHLRQHVATVHGDEPPETKAILDVHDAILGDDSFHKQVRNRIAEERRTAAWCLWQEAADLIARFSAMRDPYFEARGEDVRDMAHNLIGVLSGGRSKDGRRTEKTRVFVSRHLHSSDAMLAQRSGSPGFASESRALVSHAAILLKGFGIPAVAGLEGLSNYVHEGDKVLVDGTDGVVVVRPRRKTLVRYRARTRGEPASIVEPAPPTFIASDGTRIMLKANIENPDQVSLMVAHGLDGIGLFRTEFLISAEGGVPEEEAQLATYRRVIQQAAGASVVIRTFDIGGDKSMGLADRCGGRNPSLGVRGIRRHLASHPEELQTQLRAILRAALGADVGILIPMVTTVDDIIATKQHLHSVKEAMQEAGVSGSSDVAIGAMIETPAAAALTGAILSEVDFVSVGTNDLLQYFMAADRDNERVIQYQDAANPAFLWLLEHIITEACKAGRGKDVTVCGEVATDVHMLPHLLRMRYRAFSIPPVSATAFREACADYIMRDGSTRVP